jgi:hypothetical protein
MKYLPESLWRANLDYNNLYLTEVYPLATEDLFCEEVGLHDSIKPSTPWNGEQLHKPFKSKKKMFTFSFLLRC